MAEGATRETWEDWWPADADPPPLITRAELLRRLADEGVAVTERELRYWEREGALPAPPRRFHRGAVQALYPVWYPAVVAGVPQLRKEQRLAFDAIRLRARREFEKYTPLPWRLRSYRAPLPPRPDSLVKELRRYFVQVEEHVGLPLTSAQLTMELGPGASLCITFERDLSPPDPATE